MPRISIAGDKTQSLVLKYKSLAINSIVSAKISTSRDNFVLQIAQALKV